jgi:hypothetical protein
MMKECEGCEAIGWCGGNIASWEECVMQRIPPPPPLPRCTCPNGPERFWTVGKYESDVCHYCGGY